MQLFRYIPILCLLSACAPQKTEMIILDFGSPATPKISQRLSHFSVPHVVLNGQATAQEIKNYNPKAVILSGGPAHVYQPGSPLADPALYQMGVPILGICYGMQLMAHQLGGSVSPCTKPESKKIIPMYISHDSPLHVKSEKPVKTWMYHQDCVDVLPPGFKALGFTPDTKIAMAFNPQKQFYGVQFHPERIDKTSEGIIFLDRFIRLAREVK